MTKTYDVHWNDNGRSASFLVTVTGDDNGALSRALWAEIRKRVTDTNLVTGVWKLNY